MSEPDASATPPGEPWSRSFWLGLLHVFVLTSFAVAQPLYDLLGRNPEFFVAHGATSLAVFVFAFVVLLVPPIPLVVVELVLERVSPSIRRTVHHVVVGLLVALIFEPILEHLTSATFVLVVLGLAAGAGAAYVYDKTPFGRAFLTLLAPAPLIFLFLFFFVSPVSHVVVASQSGGLAVQEIGNPAPIVMIVFDELTSGALLNGAHDISTTRFPNLAKLASQGTWYRNATTVTDYTHLAVPAIVTGDRPELDSIPTVGDHPDNLFTVLAGRYDMNVHEAETRLCPPSVCTDEDGDRSLASTVGGLLRDSKVIYEHVVLPPHVAGDLPSIANSWGDFQNDKTAVANALTKHPGEEFRTEQAGRFDDFVKSIHSSDQPTLNFLHVLMPHVPLNRLPSGHIYPNFDYIPGLLTKAGGGFWDTDSYYGNLGLQRYLLQLEFVDREVGRLMRKLHRLHMFDDSLIVVTADHGVSFVEGEPRRALSNENASQILPVPLIVKRPHQKKGRITDQNVETIDVLPTMAALLGMDLPFSVDGTPVVTKDDPTRPGKSAMTAAGGGVIERSGDFPDKLQLTQRVLDVFPDCCGRFKTYAFGPNALLTGSEVRSLKTRKDPAAFTATFDAVPAATKTVVPAYVTGIINQPVGAVPVQLAVAVNGRIGGVGQTFVPEDGKTHFAIMAAEPLFRVGHNDVDLYIVSKDEKERTLLIRVPRS